jgi:hypothetical protein
MFNQMAAAELREKKWEDRAGGVGRRPKLSRSVSDGSDHDSSSTVINAERQPSSSSRYVEDVSERLINGFDPYVPVFSSSVAGRAALIRGVDELSVSKQPSTSQPPAAQTSSPWSCPVCARVFSPPPSEEQASLHVEECIDKRAAQGGGQMEGAGSSIAEAETAVMALSLHETALDSALELLEVSVVQEGAAAVAASVCVVKKLLENLQKSPQEEKFRQVRISNPAIQVRPQPFLIFC